MEGKFGYTPLIYIFARDDHLFRDMVSLDPLFWGTYISLDSGFYFSLNDNLKFSLFVSYKRIYGLRGASFLTFTNPEEAGKFYQNAYDGGAAYTALDASLGLKIIIKPKAAEPAEKRNEAPPR